MNGRANAEIKIDLGEVKVNSILYHSLKPEARSLPSRRVESKIGLNEAVVIEIYASDTTALRAAVNSYIRLIRTVKAIIDSVRFSSIVNF